MDAVMVHTENGRLYKTEATECLWQSDQLHGRPLRSIAHCAAMSFKRATLVEMIVGTNATPNDP